MAVESMAVLSSPFDLPPGRLLALDLGQVRIGVAVCDEQGIIARPLTVVRRKSRDEDFKALAAVAIQERVVGVLAGLPLDSRGEIGPQAKWAKKYGSDLARRLPVPLAFWDESYSTVDAEDLRRETGGKTPIDALAAAVILRSFLEARRTQPQETSTGLQDLADPQAPAATTG